VILTTDGRGEFILVPESLNSYEEFATQADAFATLTSTSPTLPGQGSFSMAFTYDDIMETWPEAWERRVVVKSSHVYGKTRRMKGLKFDVASSFGPQAAIYPNDGYCAVNIQIRAITTDFDPASITWEWAYTQGRLGLSEDYAEYLLTTGQGAMEASGLPPRQSVPFPVWNTLESIHGFELRIVPSGDEREWLQVLWSARLDGLGYPVAYVILA
jgi:hypothetical protein